MDKRDKANIILLDNMNDNAAKHIADISFLQDWIIDAMIEFAQSEVKKLNLLDITQQREQLPRKVPTLKGHDEGCKCDACRLLENIFGNCG